MKAKRWLVIIPVVAIVGWLSKSDPNVAFEMIRRCDEFLQRVHFFNWRFDVPMEIIMGSSKMAQTYLYWHKDGLYQHNVTHITDRDQWINSPGYIDGALISQRKVRQEKTSPANRGRGLDCRLVVVTRRD